MSSAAAAPGAAACPPEGKGEQGEYHRPGVRTLASDPGVQKKARDDQEPHGVEDEERADEPEPDRKDAHAHVMAVANKLLL